MQPLDDSTTHRLTASHPVREAKTKKGRQQPTALSLGATGFEPDASEEKYGKIGSLREKPAQIPAHLAGDSGVRSLLEKWDSLPEAVRTGILTILQAVGKTNGK